MESGLRGKVALVTGGGSGIGRAISLALAKEGVHVAVASRNPSQQTIKEIEAQGVRALSLSVDVTDEAQVVGMVKKTIEGLGALDLYVNDAAGAWNEPVTKLVTENWFRTLNTNLTGCVWACREVARHMIAAGKGSILIVGSTAIWNSKYGEAAYRVSKTGLRVYMETLAIELAPFNIRVNMLTPGHFPTKLTSGMSSEDNEKMKKNIPLRHFGDPSDCGNAAVFLLSDELSSYTVGSELVVDGGLKLRALTLISDEEIIALNR
jgi:NAD(P)-dependent dehydrogenase (short-subunit alcohol dehydrogenase family)